MSTNDDNVTSTEETGLNADAATQSNLWKKDDERHDDGYRRDEFGNRVDDGGNRVDPEGRPMNIEGNPVNEDGARVDDQGRPLDDGDGDAGPFTGGIIPPIPPMMGH